jgi:hypothetical protein
LTPEHFFATDLGIRNFETRKVFKFGRFDDSSAEKLADTISFISEKKCKEPKGNLFKKTILPSIVFIDSYK